MQELTYDQAFEELQEIARSLQDGSVGLEAISVKIRRAGELLQFCKTKLRETQEELEGIFDEESDQ